MSSKRERRNLFVRIETEVASRFSASYDPIEIG